jgi:hypothetical protein
MSYIPTTSATEFAVLLQTELQTVRDTILATVAADATQTFVPLNTTIDDIQAIMWTVKQLQPIVVELLGSGFKFLVRSCDGLFELAICWGDTFTEIHFVDSDSDSDVNNTYCDWIEPDTTATEDIATPDDQEQRLANPNDILHTQLALLQSIQPYVDSAVDDSFYNSVLSISNGSINAYVPTDYDMAILETTKRAFAFAPASSLPIHPVCLRPNGLGDLTCQERWLLREIGVPNVALIHMSDISYLALTQPAAVVVHMDV